MKMMRAIVLEKEKDFDSLQMREVECPKPMIGEAVVRIHASALNRRDVWITQGLYPGIKVPVILGSDGAGVVAEVGEGVDKGWLEKAVIINPAMDWGKDPRAQDLRFRILGLPDNGTQAEYVVVPAENLVPMPAHLSFEEAAAIPLAGLTGYRALFTQGKLKASETVLISGVGGGVAALMLQMAVAAGASVLVTSGNSEKIAAAVKAGAVGGVSYKGDRWGRAISEMAGPHGVDLVVDSAGGAGFNELINVVKPGGRIVFFGATAGNPGQVDLRKIFWKQLTVQGSTMGTPQDFSEMTRLFATCNIKPLIDGPYQFADYRNAYQRMMQSDQFGKIVLRHR